MRDVSWVVMGGAPGETAHCQRCGGALQVGMPIEVGVLAAAAKAFTKAHRHCEAKPADPTYETPAAWMDGRDTGVSSATICEVLGDVVSRYAPHYDVPHDPADFGRCHRLLEAFPPWRKRLTRVSKRFAAWVPFVREWEQLTALYQRDLSSGRSTELFQQIQRLVLEGRP